MWNSQFDRGEPNRAPVERPGSKVRVAAYPSYEVPTYPPYEETAAVLGPRYRELETPFGTIAYLTPALDLADGGMGAPAEYCDV